MKQVEMVNNRKLIEKFINLEEETKISTKNKWS